MSRYQEKVHRKLRFILSLHNEDLSFLFLSLSFLYVAGRRCFAYLTLASKDLG